MKKNITKLLLFADEAAREYLVKGKDNNEYIKKEQNGYISSFGAAIVQSGLLPAIYFNFNSENSSADRRAVMNAIYYILQKQDASINEDDLLKYAKKVAQKGDLRELKIKILDAATALKLVIRTYKLKKS